MILRHHIRIGTMLTLLLLSRAATAQTDSTTRKARPYALVITAGGGLAYYSTHLGVPPPIDQLRVSRFGVPAMLRVMWHPDHRLRVGLETGWVPMYSYRGTVAGEPARVNVEAIPILLVFSMPLAWLSGTKRNIAQRLSITAGTGAYLVESRLRYAGRVTETQTSLGWMLAGSYTQPLGRQFRVATELKWFNATATEDAAFTAQLQLVWRAFSW